MNTTIGIIEYVEKLTKTGKPYLCVDTTSGLMNCFDTKVCDEIIKHVGENAVVEIGESADGRFKNIVKFAGAAPGLPRAADASKVAALNKDRMIVRQSCLKASVEFCAWNEEIHVLEQAELFENWVMR